MKIRVWTGLITLALAIAILRSYVSPRPSVTETGREAETEKQLDSNGNPEEKSIRVLLKNDDFQDVFHKRLEITGTGVFQIRKGENTLLYEAGTKIRLEPETGAGWGGEKMVVSAVEPDERIQILNLLRDETPPSYPGRLEISWQEEGYLVINEAALEEYLPLVLSSEMNASFPEEALKAQAISARTYACKWMEEKNQSCFGADLDDSVSYQVYNNRNSDTIMERAAEDTRASVLLQGGELADTFYYSTSCGVTREDVFREEETFVRFLEEGRSTDLEWEEPWYRWRTAVSEKKVLENLNGMGLEAPEQITHITVAERQENGRARLLEIAGKDQVLQIFGELDIRRALAADQDICLKDGSVSRSVELLPSAWFVLEEGNGEPQGNEQGGEDLGTDRGTERTEEKQWQILGGGFGHGNGLSQNGAKCMAAAGADCETILHFYYEDIQIGSWDRRGKE